MCTGKCAKCIGGTLYPFAVICIVANVFLYFPGWSLEAAENPGLKLTTEVSTLLGIVGGGLLVLITAVQIQASGRKGCCGNRWGMFLSILCAAIGLTGSLFCLCMCVTAIHRGPVCAYYDSGSINTTDTSILGNGNLTWGRPFENALPEYNNENYIYHKDSWSICVEPPNVVEFNLILFSTMLAASSFEVILCAIQLFNGLFGVICGTCNKEEIDYKDMDKDTSSYAKDTESIPEKKEALC
ncbi:transmembrane 4 L6 family member 5-like [Hyla sarda]|uniref:transmembrane 4 L6 family member 5-like n=1 Tax=Hyla sarda TaxID=327740 RepID=UPI0024C32C83|nr:transmembrane 4 L6 family member 5-like [Hyla sarda]